MKSTFLISAFAAVLFSGLLFMGCRSSAKKVEAAEDKVQRAQQKLSDIQNSTKEDELKTVSAESWETFMSESRATIRNNEIRISELKIKMKRPGTTLDVLYEKRINALQQQNNSLNIKIEAYKENQSDWASFKREFNHDLAELGQALKDLTVSNKE